MVVISIICVIQESVNEGKRVRINNISNHTRQIYDLHCLWNTVVVKIPKIKVCNPSPFRKTFFVTSLTKQCHLLFEITFQDH